MLDDIVDVLVADCAVLTPPVINCAEDGLKQLSKLLVEVGRERRLYRRYLGEV